MDCLHRRKSEFTTSACDRDYTRDAEQMKSHAKACEKQSGTCVLQCNSHVLCVIGQT